MSGADAITAVIITHDRAAMLAQALASVRSQRGGPAEIVVVDDGSRDGTAQLLESTSDVRVVRHAQPRGPAAARNAGLAEVGTPWVAFLDDDDLWAPDKLASQRAALAAVPVAQWCYTGALAVDALLRPLGGIRAELSGDVSTSILTGNVVTGGGSSVCARTDVVRAVGCFDPAVTRYEDWDLWIRLALDGPVVAVDRPLVAYRRHQVARTAVAVSGATDRILERYARERAARGVSGRSEYEAQTHRQNLLATGRRGQAALAYARDAAHSRSPELAVGTVLALLTPGVLIHAQQRRWRERTPPDWFEQVAAWLPAAAPAAAHRS